jgi:hypothetical protein
MKPENELAMIVAFYLSKFGDGGLKGLGFESYTQAFEEIGRCLSVKPNSVKNWRDEFDPYYDNQRKGWHQRKLRQSRHKVMLAFDDLSESFLRAVVSDIIAPDARPKIETQLHSVLEEIEAVDRARASRAKADYVPRGPTGRLAEEFFVSRFRAGQTPFAGILNDCRDDGVGFDFEIVNDAGLSLLEIKGIARQPGSITFTDKEWQVAGQAQDDYYLGVVIQVIESPKIGFLRNPARHLSPAHHAFMTVTVGWNVGASQISLVQFS